MLAVTLIVSIVLICIPATSAFGVEMFCAGIGSAISGMIISGVIGGLISAINGNGFWTGALQSGITGFVDGFISGAIMYCISAGISAISNAVRAGNATCTKPSNCFVAGTLVMTARSIRAAIKQMKNYQSGLKNIKKLVLVLY